MNSGIAYRLGRTLMGCACALAASAAAPANANPGEQMFQRVSEPMSRAGKVRFCAYVAEKAGQLAGESPDAGTRAARAAAAAQLSTRLAPDLARANAKLSPADLAANERENGQAMGLLSYAPSDEVRAQLEAGADPQDIGGLFVADVISRCAVLADKLGIATIDPASVSVIAPTFRWRGTSAAEAFAATSLEPFVAKLCNGTATNAADFAGAPMAERGVDGVSLLDWAMECGDKPGFAALLAAGADPALPGAFGELPLVPAAEKRDLFYLETLLAVGAKPDAADNFETALSAAYDPQIDGGGKAWQLLRAAGANLNFPDFQKSMWDTWALYADWEQILAHWEEFASDPIHLGRSVSLELERNGGPRGNGTMLEAIKARLIADYGVCFPVGPTLNQPEDERGFYIQPDCPRNTAP